MLGNCINVHVAELERDLAKAQARIEALEYLVERRTLKDHLHTMESLEKATQDALRAENATLTERIAELKDALEAVRLVEQERYADALIAMGKKLKKAEVGVLRLLDMVESISAERDEWRDAADEQDTLLGKANADKKECEHELVSLRHTLDDLVGIQRNLAEAAESELAKVREQISGRCECCAHRDAEEVCVCREGSNWTPAWGKEGMMMAWTPMSADPLERALDEIEREWI